MLWLSLFLSPAHACGGFFCNSEERVDQTAERIVFAIDKDADTVETHVQVTYEGPASEFAWIVPTPSVPEIFESSQALFTALENRTAPRFAVEWLVGSDCESSLGAGAGGLGGGFGGMGGGGIVALVDASQVGAYDTVTLQATSSEALLDWLQAHDFDLPDDLAPRLAPYIASGSSFVALRLSKGRDAGDLRPIGLRYAGTEAVIPLQLTSVAAVPDMQLRVWVLGSGRAVPDNYLHVEVNEARIDWFTGGSNYNDIVRQAADEAGGQAFATDTSMAVGRWMDASIWQEAVELAGDAGNANRFMTILSNAGMTTVLGMQDILESCLELPPDAGIEARDYWNCPSCYTRLEVEVDLAVCAARIEEEIVVPAAGAADLLQSHAWVTRLTSSVSPEEMTLDPRFVLHEGGLPDTVEPVRRATVEYACEDGQPLEEATRVLTLPTGEVVWAPSLVELGTTSYGDWIAPGVPAAALITQTGVDDPQPVRDTRDETTEVLDAIAAGADPADPLVVEEDNTGGRSCDAGAGMGLLWWLPLAVLRRRRSATTT